MRRHLLLLALIVAIVIAIALLRSGRTSPVHVIRPTAPVESRPEVIPDPRANAHEVATAPPAVENNVPAPQSEPVKPEVQKPSKTIRVRVAIVDANSQPVESAVVLVLRPRDFEKTYQSSELRSDKEGMVELDVLQEREWMMVYSYKVGVGYSYRHFYGKYLTDDPLILKLMRASSGLARIRCVGPDGAPLENVDIAISAEIQTSSSYDIYGNYLGSKFVRLPARNARTKEDGRCELDGLPDMSWIADRENRIPGCRFTITATWQGRTTDKKIDGFPKNEIQFVLE